MAHEHQHAMSLRGLFGLSKSKSSSSKSSTYLADKKGDSSHHSGLPPPTYSSLSLNTNLQQPEPPHYNVSPSASEYYKRLAQFDTVFLIDDSGSMSGPNWSQTSDALAAVVPICTAHDSDGVDIYFLNSHAAHTNIRSSADVLAIFDAVRPSGATPTGRRLGDLFTRYMKLYKQDPNIKPINIIVITDGVATDPRKLEKNIIDTAKELDKLKAKDRQIGVQFFQVGSDEAATESLVELDNSLGEASGARDMVDTVSWRDMNGGNGLSAEGILKVVMGGIDKRMDRKWRF